jgi:hypothetical protein
MSELSYAYAVTRSEQRLPSGLRGVYDAPVQLLAHEGVAAVLSPVPAADFEEEPLRRHLEDLDWLERTARAHQAVIDALARTAAVLPLRLGVVYRGRESIERMLAEDHERLVSTLDRLDGRIEWGVKVYLDDDLRPKSPPAEPMAAAGAVTGRDYLRGRLRRRSDEDTAWELADRACQLLQAQLSQLAEAERVLRPQDPRLADAPGRNVLNASYLVRQEESEEFATCVRESSLPGVRIELTGPWAPYSFADPEEAR